MTGEPEGQAPREENWFSRMSLKRRILLVLLIGGIFAAIVILLILLALYGRPNHSLELGTSMADAMFRFQGSW
jgi:flagellar biosynthesis/type III secretory pathway M-ring protein FliF/YscJ